MDVEEDVLLKTHLRKSRYIENVALLSTCDTVRIIEEVTARKKVYGRFTKFIFHSTKLLTTISATSNCAYISVFCQPSIRESVVQVALIFATDVAEDVLLKTHLRKSRYTENVALLSTCDTVRIIEHSKKVYERFTKFIFYSTKLLTAISASGYCAYISVCFNLPIVGR